MLKAAFTYEPDRNWLSSVIYRSIATGEIIGGSKCRYDAVGNRIEEVQLRRGRDFGERYFYDSANRLVKVQYGVKRLSDPDSQFEKEVLYELSSTGIWQLKMTRDANGQTLDQDMGAANARETYSFLGNRHFEYDANGNRLIEKDGEDHDKPKRKYRYDYANRLVGVESLDANGLVVQTIEYAYDAFNHQVLKRITKDGETREYNRVWNGSQLIEEWEDGKLAKSFSYGAGINEPLKMSLYSEREPEEYFYTLDGRNSVTGLIDQQAKTIEGYRYDVYGQPFLTVYNGQEANQSILSSTVKNALLGNANIFDLDTDLYILGPSSYDAGIGQAVNGRGRGGSDPLGGLHGPGTAGHRGLDLSGLPGGDPRDNGGGDPLKGLHGPGTAGHRGLDLSGLPGGDPRDNGGGDPLKGLHGPGTAGHRGLDLSGLPGGDPRDNGGGDPLKGLHGPGTAGHRGLDLSNLGGDGGPSGFGSNVGPGGAWTPNDAEKTAGNKVATWGGYFMAAGLAAAVKGDPKVAAALIGFGAGMYIVGSLHEINADKDKPGPAEPAPTAPTPAPKPEEPAVKIPVFTRPPEAKPAKPPEPKPAEPKPEEPKPKGSLYPDPGGGGGGGDPTQLRDYDDSGGGNPTMRWEGGNQTYVPDYDGSGGGDPTTLWDENGGGGDPTTVTANATMTLFITQFT